MAYIDTIATAIHDEFVARPLAWATGAVAFRTGQANLFSHEGTPFVCWVYDDEGVITDDTLHNGPRARSASSQGKPFCARRLLIDAYIFGGSVTQAEELLEELMSATFRTANPAARFRGNQWPDHRSYEAAKLGELVVMRLSVDKPVDARRWSLGTIASQSTTYDVDDS